YAAARLEPDPHSRLGVGRRGQPMVELGKAFGGAQAAASCHGFKRRVEFNLHIESASDAAKPDYLGAGRQGGQELRTLYRRGFVRQCQEPARYTALPFLGRPRYSTHRQAAQVAQGQCQQATRPERRREGRQQAKGKRRGTTACDNRQGGIVEL